MTGTLELVLAIAVAAGLLGALLGWVALSWLDRRRDTLSRKSQP